MFDVVEKNRNDEDYSDPQTIVDVAYHLVVGAFQQGVQHGRKETADEIPNYTEQLNTK